ncbi:CocE/NonD family hydrolase [Nocardia sp. NPDC050175]|uniref:CocE/NonD family hydrolase n=1 Tax=Nocardia sp. NPDC050175 TaxID=3364317 RepID=UPI00378C2DD1
MFEFPLLMTEAKSPHQNGYPGLRPSSEVRDGKRIERDVAVSMRDGTILYVDILRPETEARVPVLLAYTPYGKHNTIDFQPNLAEGADIDPPLPAGTVFEAPAAAYWVAHGYAVVYADTRGSWGCEGNATYFSLQEALDGYDLVEWAGTQAWSNGKVGMSGVSYLALVQYGVAATRPPHLAAITAVWSGESERGLHAGRGGAGHPRESSPVHCTLRGIRHRRSAIGAGCRQ